MRHVIFCLVISCSLMGCDVLEDELWDCIDQDGPRFRSNTLPDATIDVVYRSEINAFIKREILDDRYSYHWSWHGDLPGGLSVSEQGTRTLVIDGVPLATGTYFLNVTVSVYDPQVDPNYDIFNGYDDGDNLCRDTYSHKFVLVVTQ